MSSSLPFPTGPEIGSLVRRAQQGDLQAFNSLVLASQDEVYSLAYHTLGDEALGARAAQQAFLRAYRELPRFQRGSWRAWLYRCAVQVLQSLMSKEVTARSPRSGGVTLASPGLDALPFDLRLVLALVDLEGLDYEEAAAVLEVSPQKIKSRLARARQQLTAG